MAVDNENAIVNTPATTSETPSNLVAEGKGNELSPNPAGFGFTKQLFVDSLPVSGQDKTIYLIKHGSGYLKYKWNLAERKFERVFDPLPNKLNEGEHKVAKDERVAPKVAPEKVFNGLVVFLGDVRGLDKTTFGKAVVNAIGKLGDEKIKQNEATNTTEITNNVEIQGFLKLNGNLIGFDIPIVSSDPTSEPATADSPTFVSYNGIIFANVNGEYVSFSAGQIEDGTITKEKFAAGAFDSELNEESTNAVQNKVLFLALEDVAKVNGNYQTMTVGLADNLVATNGLTTTKSFIMELTGGDQASAVSTGNMNLTLRGNSVVVNQLSQIANKTEQTNSGITWKITDHVMTATGTASANIYNEWETIPLIAGHKYFINGKNTMLYTSGQDLTHDGDCGIVSCLVSGNYTYQWNIPSGAVANYKFRLLVIDLTQWFNGNIPQDLLDHPEKFINYYQGSLAYDTGHIENAQSTSLISRGINQFNESALRLGVSVSTVTGNTYNNANAFTTDFIEVVLYSQYHVHIGQSYSNLYMCGYDKDKNLIASYPVYTSQDFNVSSGNATYIRFSVQGYGSSYNNNVCFNISNQDINGNYFASEVNETPLGNDVLRSAGSVYDSKEPNGTIHRLVGRVDLGDLNWAYEAGNARFYCHLTASHNAKKASASNVKANLLCARYINVDSTTASNNSTDMCIAFDSSAIPFVIIHDSHYTDPTALKTALTGVYLYYELAEETTEQGTAFAENIKVVKGGTLEFVGNGIPQGNSMFFQKNLKSFLEAFGTAINYDPSRIERLANLSFTPETADIVLNPSPANAYAKVQVMSSTFTIVVSAALTGTASGSITFQDSEVDLTNFETEPAKAIYDMDGKKVSEAPTTTDCNIASFVGRSYNGVVLWSILHSGVNKIKIHFEQAIPLDENGNGKVDCRASLIL